MFFEEGLKTFALLVDRSPSDPQVQQCYAISEGNLDMAVDQFFSEFQKSEQKVSKKRRLESEEDESGANKRTRMADSDEVQAPHLPSVQNLSNERVVVNDVSQVSGFAREELRLQALHQRGAVRERHNMAAVSPQFADASLSLAINRAARANVYHCIIILDDTPMSHTIAEIFRSGAIDAYGKHLTFSLLYSHMPEAVLVSSCYKVERTPCQLLLETYRGLCLLRIENLCVRASRVSQHLLGVYYFLLGGGADINGNWSTNSTTGKDYTHMHNIMPEIRLNESVQNNGDHISPPLEYSNNDDRGSNSSSNNSSSSINNSTGLLISPKYLMHAGTPLFPSKFEILVMRFIHNDSRQREVGPTDHFEQVSNSVMTSILHAFFHTVTANTQGFRVATQPGRAYDLISIDVHLRPIPKIKHLRVLEHTLRDALRLETCTNIKPIAVVDLEADEHDTIQIEAILPRGETVHLALENHLDQQQLSVKLVEVLLQHQYTPKTYKVLADCGAGRQFRVKLANPNVPSGKRLVELKFSKKVIIRLTE